MGSGTGSERLGEAVAMGMESIWQAVRQLRDTRRFLEEALKPYGVVVDGHLLTQSGVQASAIGGKQGNLVPAAASGEGAETKCVFGN